MSALRDEFERRTGYIIQPGEHVLEYPDGSFDVLREQDKQEETKEEQK